MTIYAKEEPDWINPRVCAACYQEWITECWRELPFTRFTNSGHLRMAFNYRELPRLSGLYAVSAVLLPHHLNLPIVQCRGKACRIAERLPAWVDAKRRSQRFVHLLYVGETDNFAARWRGHEKMIDFRIFQQHLIEMRFHFYANPPASNLHSGDRVELERRLIHALSPLLNFR